MKRASSLEKPQRKGRRVPLIAALATASLIGGGAAAGGAFRGHEKPAAGSATAAEAPRHNTVETPRMTGKTACKSVVDVALKPETRLATPPDQSPLGEQVSYGIDLTRAITVSSEAAFLKPTADHLASSLEEIASTPLRAKGTDAVVKASIAELANTASYSNSSEAGREITAAAATETDALIERLAPDNDTYHADVEAIRDISALENPQASTEQLVVLSNRTDKEANQIAMGMITERDGLVRELCAPFPDEINRYQNQ